VARTIRIGILSKPSQFHLLRSLHRLGRQRADIFAFSPSDMNWQQRTVRAHFLTAGGRWERRVIDLPDVVYNRYLCGRTLEFQPAMRNFRKLLKEHRIPIFNWSYFNKQEVFDRLRDGNERRASEHLPATVKQATVKSVLKMFDRFSQIFLKPVGGFAGFGIYRLLSAGPEDARLHFHRGRKPIVMRFPSRQAMIQYVQKQTRGFHKYIAQQGIALLRYQDCPVDFRVHLNRGRGGQWRVSGIGAKKAGKGSVTTHIRTGGRVFHPERILRYFFRNKADDVLNNMHSAAIHLAQAIARTTPRLVGELGFDLGIDTEGKIWMFEANSKPGRSIFKHPSLRRSLASLDRNLIEYCIHLANQQKQGGSAS
jgi:hypothetical protein